MSLDRATEGALVERPTLEIPPFCSWFAPRIEGIPERELAALRALSVTVDEAGDLVEREE
ncbi:MAG: hypothetical protein EA397_16910 [Deltaproteobacteria bacterium]|nr:MAG: hypothetical protein EA397_16910 [Deltaproteobacteria bacterium]